MHIYNLIATFTILLFPGGRGHENENHRPIIGVLAQGLKDFGIYHPPSASSYISASYVKFIEGGGAQVAPIFINQDKSYYEELFGKINGVLLPGGASNISNLNGYAAAAKILLQLARGANDAGVYFPVWGTCLGLEFMAIDAAGWERENPLSPCAEWNVLKPVTFTANSLRSKLYTSLPPSALATLSTESIAPNFHTFCLSLESWKSFGINQQYIVTSTNYDEEKDMKYVASMEHRVYPFYATQFHPEKDIYEWSIQDHLVHDAQATRIWQYVAQFFVNEARKNQHRFETFEDEAKHLIYNYKTTFTGVNVSNSDVNEEGIYVERFTEVYFFPQ